MSRLAHAMAGESNRRTNKCSVDFSWPVIFQKLFPENTAAYVASFTRTNVRAAEHVLNKRNGLGGKALVNLLRSPVGRDVLDALAGDADWRAVERRRLDIAKLEEELENLERKRRELSARL